MLRSLFLIWCQIPSTKFICIQQKLISDFSALRGRPEDPHVKRFNELHEPSAYFRHCSWWCDVHSAAEGELRRRNVHKYTKGVSCHKQMMTLLPSCRRKNLQRTTRLFGYEDTRTVMSHAPISHQPSGWDSNVRGALGLLFHKQNTCLSAV